MPPAFNLQIIFGLLLIGGIAACITTSLDRRGMPSRLSSVLFGAQLLVSLVNMVLAFALYCSLVPIPRLNLKAAHEIRARSIGACYLFPPVHRNVNTF